MRRSGDLKAPAKAVSKLIPSLCCDPSGSDSIGHPGAIPDFVTEPLDNIKREPGTKTYG
ncbi:hypothetical protein GCM10011575_39710 [Microlunatus endophyticus]|uniref:Uncharacterized protein n=1 Tax=Microlunatus endophyticus TaxID=1716077 RepID=A0A917W8L4_9ACTN|nr:hypothetical protein GCM10011575_39710 [Microlunatus endophyticus]